MSNLFAHVVTDHHAWYGVESVVWIVTLDDDGAICLERVSDRFRDHRHARGRKLKGSTVTYMLHKETLYLERRRLRRSEHEDVYFFVSEVGGLVALTDDEAREWLISKSAT